MGTYDVQDRLLTHGSNTYTYTADGHLPHDSHERRLMTTYQYDEVGNLVGVTLPDGT